MSRDKRTPDERRREALVGRVKARVVSSAQAHQVITQCNRALAARRHEPVVESTEVVDWPLR